MELFLTISTLKIVPAERRQESADDIITDKNAARTNPERKSGRVVRAIGIANAGVLICCCIDGIAMDASAMRAIQIAKTSFSRAVNKVAFLAVFSFFAERILL